ncbi:hypothetical protein M885DRAFT_532928 [Pelagophyceae sp. CCMP2097]|nr:hypothetical protein M885DRAFT_532928 [Pelagophyceae sp. CCMP2097]
MARSFSAVIVALVFGAAGALAPATRTRTARNVAVSMVFGKTRDSKRAFVPAVATSAVKPGSAVSAICSGLDICIAVDSDGSVYALGNKSPILGTPLAGGTVKAGTIKDSLTGTTFSLRTGEIVGPFAPNFPFSILFALLTPSGLPVFKCQAANGQVSVEVDVNAKTNFECVGR